MASRAQADRAQLARPSPAESHRSEFEAAKAQAEAVLSERMELLMEDTNLSVSLDRTQGGVSNAGEGAMLTLETVERVSDVCCLWKNAGVVA